MSTAATVIASGDGKAFTVVPDDAETKRLVARCKAGDLRAMEALYLRYFDQVFAYALLSLRDRHEAEDLTQGVFEKVLGQMDRYRPDPKHSFEAWLFRVTRNAVLDARKRQESHRTEALETDDEKLRGSNGEGGAELESVLHWIKDSDLALFVERLPEGQRDVISLHYLLGWRFKDIAELLEKTPAAVSELHRSALHTLEARMRAVKARAARRRKRAPMLIRLRPRRVMVSRRFALGSIAAPAPSPASMSSLRVANTGLMVARRH